MYLLVLQIAFGNLSTVLHSKPWFLTSMSVMRHAEVGNGLQGDGVLNVTRMSVAHAHSVGPTVSWRSGVRTVICARHAGDKKLEEFVCCVLYFILLCLSLFPSRLNGRCLSKLQNSRNFVSLSIKYLRIKLQHLFLKMSVTSSLIR